jgi:hypothetical protein
MARGISVGELYATLRLDNSQFKVGVAESGGLFSRLTNHVGGLFKTLAKTVAVGAAAIIGALTAAGTIGARFAETYYKASLKISQITGLNISESSKLLALFQRFGLQDNAAKALAMMEKNAGLLSSTTKKATAFQKLWGFSVRDASGHVKDANALLNAAADYFVKTKDKAKVAALESKLFGKSWQEMTPILALGSKGIKAAGDAAAALGLVLTKSNVEDLAKYRQSTLDMDEAMGGLKLMLGLFLMPLFTAFANFMTTTLIPGIHDVITKVGDWVHNNQPLIDQVAGFVRDALGKFVSLISGIPDVIGSIATKVGDWYAANKPLVDSLVAMAQNVVVTGIQTLLDLFRKSGDIGPIVLAIGAAFIALNLALDVLEHHPIILVLSGIVLALGGLRTAWDDDFGNIQEQTKGTLDNISDMFDNVRTFIQPLFDAVANLGKVLGSALDDFSQFVGRIGDHLRIIIGDITTFLQPLFARVQDLIDLIAKALRMLGILNAEPPAYNRFPTPTPSQIPGTTTDVYGPNAPTVLIPGTTTTRYGFASGVRDFMGGFARVGERGPENMYVPRGSSVTTADDTNALVAAARLILKGGGGTVNHNSYLTVQGNLVAKDEPSVLQTLKRMQTAGSNA